jgi:CrcB protein
MRELSLWLAVAGGGAMGATMRYAVGRVTARLVGTGFPWATLFVNVVGSFAMGLLIVWLMSRQQSSEALRAFLAVGVLGAFTTFSTFSLDVVTLFERKAYAAAGGYLAASVAFSIGGLVLGLVVGRAFL